MSERIEHPTPEQILAAVLRERRHQDEKRGTPAERNLALMDYRRIARRELQEAAEAFTVDDSLAETLQAMTVLWAAIEQHGLVERDDFVWLKSTI